MVTVHRNLIHCPSISFKLYYLLVKWKTFSKVRPSLIHVSSKIIETFSPQEVSSSTVFSESFRWLIVFVVGFFILIMGRPCMGQSRTSSDQHWKYDSSPMIPDAKEDNDRWDPVTWFSQRGYNVTQMIYAPGKKKIAQCRNLWIFWSIFHGQIGTGLGAFWTSFAFVVFVSLKLPKLILRKIGVVKIFWIYALNQYQKSL